MWSDEAVLNAKSLSSKVIFLSTGQSKEINAFTSRILAIASGLKARGFECERIHLYPNIDLSIVNRYRSKIEFSQLGIKQIKLFDNKVTRRIVLWGNLLYLIKYVLTIREKNNIIGCYGVPEGIVIGTVIRTVLKRKKILLLYDKSEHPFYNRNAGMLERLRIYLHLNYVVHHYDSIFVISEGLREYYSKLLESKRSKATLSILPILVEPDQFNLKGLQKSTSENNFKDIVYIGTMYGDKDGVYNLIEAFGLIASEFPDSNLVLVGDNSKKKRMGKINNAIAKIEFPERVVFTGLLSKPEVAEKISSAYCLALARPANMQAKYGFPTKLGEYLATGRPVVITSVGDIPLYLEDGVNAYISEPGDVNAFAEKLRECFSDREKAEQIGKEGQKLAYGAFHYEKAVQVIVDELNKNDK
ncbi:MAG: glycosyltransferase family 4 protein [Sphaerochaetaceae bacterium]